jgi:hypothetical protein
MKQEWSKINLSLLSIVVAIVFLNKISLPNKISYTIFLLLSLSYFGWRRYVEQYKMAFIVANVTIAYWLMEAFWRINNGILYYYHYTVKTHIVHISTQKAILGALPYAIIAFAIFYDLIFLKKAEDSFLYFNIDLLPHDDTKWINELKQEKRSKKMIAYSKKGANAAKSKAIELGLKDIFVDFVSEEEADKRRGMSQ